MCIFCTHSGLCWNGIIHGFQPTNKRYIPFCPSHHRFLTPDRRPFRVAAEIFDVPLPAFHMCGLDAPLWTEWAYVGSVAICGTCPALGWNRDMPLTCPMTRPGGFHLRPCVHNKNQVCPGSTAHDVASHEDLNPGLVDIFLYRADFQPHRVGICGHG